MVIITTSAAAALADGVRVRLVLRGMSIVESIVEITMYQTVEGNENFHATKDSLDGWILNLLFLAALACGYLAAGFCVFVCVCGPS